MKRIVILILAISVLMCGCDSLKGRLYDTSSTEIENLFEKVLGAATRCDMTALKSLFSRNALLETSDIDEQIEALFSFFNGDVISVEKRGNNGRTYKKGFTQRQSASAWYEVQTDSANYFFIIIAVLKDTECSDNVGVYSLRVILDTQKDLYFNSWDGMEIPGVFVPLGQGDGLREP